MQGFDVFLVVVGFVIIAISYFISEKVTTKGTLNNPEYLSEGQVHDIWTAKDEKNIKDRVDILLADKTEEVVVMVDDQLSQISNEKIMAVSEFSDQALEKINQNHTEVVFLYNMLNEKEDEIKLLINQIDKMKAQISDEQFVQESGFDKKEVSDENSIRSHGDEKQQGISEYKIAEAVEKRVEPWNEMGQNNNEQILKMHKSGKSIMEIAKILELGQGEVKLVIDLHRGVKS